ncbi:MAG: large conductance mechanosensitive channel protein MscL [Thermoanaerobaculia bacterium]
MLKEFKEFAVQGNVMDMAVGIIMGGVFTPIANSVVSDVVMPPIGLALGGVDFKNLLMVLKEGTPAGPYATLDAAKAAGAVTINYGNTLNTIVSFLVTSFAVFLLVKAMNKMRREQPKAAEPAK